MECVTGQFQAHVVHEDCAEVADDVDDSENQTPGAEHGEVGASVVAVHRSAGLVRVGDGRGADPIVRRNR